MTEDPRPSGLSSIWEQLCLHNLQLHVCHSMLQSISFLRNCWRTERLSLRSLIRKLSVKRSFASQNFWRELQKDAVSSFTIESSLQILNLFLNLRVAILQSAKPCVPRNKLLPILLLFCAVLSSSTIMLLTGFTHRPSRQRNRICCRLHKSECR